MSETCKETVPQLQSVDIEGEAFESPSRSEMSCDSGFKSVEHESKKPLVHEVIDEHDEKDTKYERNISKDATSDTSIFDSLSSPTSLSPELDDVSDNTMNLDDALNLKNDVTDNYNVTKQSDSAVVDTTVENVIDNSPSLENDSNLVTKEQRNNFNLNETNLKMSSQNITLSTMSLNEQLNSENTLSTNIKYSKSVENLPTTIDIVQNHSTLNTNEIDTDKILSEYINQKPKVNATQKIPDCQPVSDSKYPRIPKDLTQDLGSIVKNVHGIFSSVSGSIMKNAYSMSQRPVALKPVITKPVTNSKIMKEIFEEPTIDSVESETKENSTENLVLEQNGDMKCDIVKLQVESLEKLLAEQRKVISGLRERVQQQSDEIEERDHTFKELEGKMDLMRKHVEQSDREKDAAVMRYASSECAVIDARRAAETSSRAEKAALVEVDLLSAKVKSAHAEKQRICQLYDDKCHELQTVEKELAKVKEDGREMEGRLKWTQNKLRAEMDAYKESTERVEKLSQQISELETKAVGACDSTTAKVIESELKESQASLILCRHEKAELEKRVSSLSHQLETCKRERDEAMSSLDKTNDEVSSLRALTEQLSSEAASLAALRVKAALADTLTGELDREKDRVTELEQLVSVLKSRAEHSARREEEALRHAETLTHTHVTRVTLDKIQDDKVQALSSENASLRARLSAAECALTASSAALSGEVDRRNRENRVLARKVAELTEELSATSDKLEWEKGENGVLKKKHANAIKELNRELQRALKRCEQLEAKIPHADEQNDRTGSISSLSSGESAAPSGDERANNGHVNEVPSIQIRSPDRQALIERIVSLQRAAARRAERCDFLEEHCRQLTDELRTKARVLRQLLMDTPTGAMTDGTRDEHKREMSRLGGAMSAVWGGAAGGMTLELSLQVNNKLQALLEDTLLKNITLKENMDTLGEEISRLKATNRQTNEK